MSAKKVALLIIDVQKSAVTKQKLPKKIEEFQNNYTNIFVSIFQNKQSPILKILNWSGYKDEALAFQPIPKAFVFHKSGYTSYLSKMKDFTEIHLCGFDTDACIYKTAMDLI